MRRFCHTTSFAPGCALVWAAVIVSTAALVPAASPQAAAPPSPVGASASSPQAAAPEKAKGMMKGGYVIHESFDVGGHIAQRSGSGSMYNTLVNVHTGPRILNGTLSARPTSKVKHPWFDDLFTANSGYGGDPEDFSIIRMSKGKLYQFQGSFRRDRQYFDYDLLANPLVPPGLVSNGYTFPQVLNSPHLFNTVRRMIDADLTLLPLSKVSFHVGFSRNRMEGPTYSSYHQGADALLLQNWQNTTDAWRFGADWKMLPLTTLSIDEVIVHYVTDTRWQLTGLNLQLSNGAPVTLGFDNTSVPRCLDKLAPIVTSATSPPTANPTCNGFLDYARAAPTHIWYPTEEFRFQSSSLKNIQMNGEFRYTGASMHLPNYAEYFNGLETRTHTRSIVMAGTASGQRVNVNADFGLVWQIMPRLSLSEQVGYEAFRVPGTDNYLQTSYAGSSMLLPPATPGTTSPILDAYFLGQKTTENSLVAKWQATPRAAVSLGYRFLRRNILRRDPSSTDHFIVDHNGGLLGADLDPTPNWKIFGSIELAYADATYLQLTPRQMQHYQLRTIYRYKSLATLSGSFDDLERRNSEDYINHRDHVRSVGVDAEFSPSTHFSVDTSYGYLDVFTRTNECYTITPAPANAVPAPAVCVDAGTPYLSNGYYDAPNQYGSFGIQVPFGKQVKTGFGYRINAVDGATTAINPRQVPGSLQSHYQTPYADATWTVNDGWAVHGAWNYYGYGELGPAGPTLPRDFHSNIYTLGMIYKF